MHKTLGFVIGVAIAGATLVRAATDPLAWPELSKESRPWAYWWWPGSAVDATNITRQMERYRDAGMGGVHIIPIYGAIGSESNYLSYLSPGWMRMMGHAVSEARRMGMDVDMTTGTGWCFGGGPYVGNREGNASFVSRTFKPDAGSGLTETFDPETQALAAYAPDGTCTDLKALITADGTVNWKAPGPGWTVYAISQKFSGQKVKRPAPGGEGPMLNLLYPEAMNVFLRSFTEAFDRYSGPKPRAQYHDSYEYRSEWAPDFLDRFAKLRGYRLETQLPALFGNGDADRSARVKTDYRETVSDIMADESLPMWVKWSHQHGFITRNEAHGSPGNWLDLYALADIPETEMFRLDRSLLISKFASSAAHVKGGRFTSAETGTWLKEHFTETLADMKYLQDDMFLSGINHIFYHGCCYSPDEAAWPGWLFYASYEMNPRNSIWHDVLALNTYAARCQAVLQSGQPDNDVLLYWPIYDFWRTAGGLLPHIRIHGPDWFDNQPVSKAAGELWQRGYGFDYISDHQLTGAKTKNGEVQVTGGTYRVVAVPACEQMPLGTLASILALAKSGATVIFQNHLPKDVPGWANLESRRAEFKKLLGGMDLIPSGDKPVEINYGKGRVLIGALDAALQQAGVLRETMTDLPGVGFIRRSLSGGCYYFVANRGEPSAEKHPAGTWITLAKAAKAVAIMDPLTGQTGLGAVRQTGGGTQVYIELPPGGSLILKTFDKASPQAPRWQYWHEEGTLVPIKGQWHVEFISGGPTLPRSFDTDNLKSWTDTSDADAQNFAGTVRYSIKFDRPSGRPGPWHLDLGTVCQSARVKLNGYNLGTLITPPFHVRVDALKSKNNQLEVEVTNVSANRIRDLDRRGVKWKIFHDINFVNQDYRPFNAADWPLHDSGLLGPVTLTALDALNPQ